MNSANSVIAAAVEPLRAVAVERAEAALRARAAAVLVELEAVGWDLNLAAPRPGNRDTRRAYAEKSAKRGFYSRLVVRDAARAPFVSRPGDPAFVIADPAAVEREVERAREVAAADYEAFVIKLSDKVGAGVVSASLSGDSVWSYSVLRVEFEDGRVENWKTQQIVNVSVLGKLFNQWPSRKVK